MNTRRSLVAIAALAVVDFALVMISGIPRYRDATAGMDAVVGEVCWFGFLLGALTLIVIGLLALVRRVRRTRANQPVGR